MEMDATIKEIQTPWSLTSETGPASPKAMVASFTQNWETLSISPASSKANSLDTDLKRQLEAVGELTVELDQLFAEMGQQTTVLRVGSRVECRIAAGLTRRLELVLGEEVEDVQLACRLNEKKHTEQPETQLDERMAPEPFSLGVCDTARQAYEDGPYREFREADVYHAVSVNTDSNSIFVNLAAKQECHVIFVSKARTKNISKTKLPGAPWSAPPENTGMTLEMQKLMTKVKEHKNNRYVERKTKRPAKLLNRKVERRKGMSFGELVFPEGRPREQHQIDYARWKVLQLWMGRPTRERGPVWAKLSPEFPQKLAHKLVRMRQEQSILTSVAIAGGFHFLFQRQRQLHLMRARTGLRQLAVYKAVFAASRFLIFACYMMKGRQQAKAKRSGTLVPTSSRRMSQRRRSSDFSFLGDAPLMGMVRKYLRRPGKNRENREECTVRMDADLAQHLALQGFHIRPSENSKRRANRPKRHHQNAATRLAAKLGRQMQSAPEVISNADSPMELAIQEVSQSTLMMTVTPHELALMAKNKAKVQLMGVQHFERFYVNAVQRAADELMKQRAREAAQLELDKNRRRIIKRYRLRFFEEEADLPWLPLHQTLMLVIRGKSMFLTASEQSLYDLKITKVNEERRAAARLAGYFPPLEAVLLCHPVIVGLTTKMQDLSDSVTSWKSALFHGRQEKLSSRALQGHQFLADDRESQMLRTCVNVGGPFNVLSRRDVQDPPAVNHDHFLSTTTSSGSAWRAFGHEDVQSYRLVDPVRELPALSEPRLLRFEDACRERQQNRAAYVARHLGERTADMVADGEARSQQRFHSWAMSSQVPEEAQQWKAKVLPFFDEFASTCSSFRSPGVTASSFFDVKNSSSETWKRSVLSGEAQAQDSGKPPSTAEEVGRWLASHDALQSVRGDAMKTACGWVSGFRKDPMSMDEVLNVRVLERSNTAFTKRKKEQELYRNLT